MKVAAADHAELAEDEEEEEDEEFEEEERRQQYFEPWGLGRGGPFARLPTDGPQASLGSGGHPDACVPCTFYCFTQRGCQRGVKCGYCHLTHQSKLQQRREVWKKQQREKRKILREREAAARAAAELAGTRLPGRGGKGGDGSLGESGSLCGSVDGAGQGKGAAVVEAVSLADGGHGSFTYSTPSATLTVGQEVEYMPQQLPSPAAEFRLLAPLPRGLTLDPSTGVISGSPVIGLPSRTAIVEADISGGSSVRARVELEVVDFTRGGFVIGHISEFAPGKFMLLLSAPDACGGGGGANSEDTGSHTGPPGSSAGGRRGPQAAGQQQQKQLQLEQQRQQQERQQRQQQKQQQQPQPQPQPQQQEQHEHQ